MFLNIVAEEICFHLTLGHSGYYVWGYNKQDTFVQKICAVATLDCKGFY